jgi:hypothetical protein
VRFLNGVVRGEIADQAQPFVEELSEREVRGPLVAGAGLVEEGPGLAEVVVLLLLCGTWLAGGGVGIS